MRRVNRIYHIDDDEEDRELFKTAVKEYDHTIRVIGEQDAMLALKNLASGIVNHIDLIVVDLNMPKILGTDCVARIRQIENLHDIPIVVLSTSTNPGDRIRAEQVGAFYITKPANLPELRNSIGDFIANVLAQWLHQHAHK